SLDRESTSRASGPALHELALAGLPPGLHSKSEVHSTKGGTVPSLAAIGLGGLLQCLIDLQVAPELQSESLVQVMLGASLQRRSSQVPLLMVSTPAMLQSESC